MSKMIKSDIFHITCSLRLTWTLALTLTVQSKQTGSLVDFSSRSLCMRV